MKRLVMVMALTCVLSGVALAGDIPMTSPAPAADGGITQTPPSIAATVILTILSLVR